MPNSGVINSNSHLNSIIPGLKYINDNYYLLSSKFFLLSIDEENSFIIYNTNNPFRKEEEHQKVIANLFKCYEIYRKL